MLLVNPADLLTFSYGQDSFNRHVALARSHGADVVIYENERIALDLDIPEDFDLLRTTNSIPVFL